MAFHLNVGGGYLPAHDTPAAAASVTDMRRTFHFQRKTEYFNSPGLYALTATLTFCLGLTLASLRLGENALRYDLDMTPVGSIVAKSPVATAPAPGEVARACN